VKATYLSPRAIALHFALVAWFALCAAATWWQVTRAFAGNSLSFLYSIEWPVFAIMGIFGWWALLHQEKITEHQEKARRDYEAKMRAEAELARQLAAEQEDPELAAYNEHLRQLAAAPRRKLFGH